MNRRAFIAALGSAATWPVVARAQQSGKIPRIGVLWNAPNEEVALYLVALRQGLNDVGYIEGKNIELLNRFADKRYDRFDALVADLIAAKVDLIFTSTTASVLAAKRATTTIPVVFLGAPDPVALHIVDSLAHPGGNLTGISPMFTDLTGKHLEILKDCFPGLSSAVLLNNPNSPFAGIIADNGQTAAHAANIKLLILETGKSDDLKQVFSVIAQQKAGAVIIPADATLLYERKQIAELAVAHRLPTIGPVREMAEAGLLLSYGPEFPELYRRAGVYIDKILKGAKPADLPVERATKFNLIVNMKTARAIGVTILDSTQLLAETIIE